MHSSDLLCHKFPPRSTALLLGGNARSFIDPRVYSSIKHNLMGGYGGQIVLFAFIKPDPETNKPTQNHLFALPTDLPTRVEHALNFIAKDTPTKNITRAVNASVYFNPKCEWPAKQDDSIALAYSGQLYSNFLLYQMMSDFEKERNTTFDTVIRTRPDMLWLHSVRPWCTYDHEAAYLSHRQPQDWFFMIPRRIAKEVLSVPYEAYSTCDVENTSTHSRAHPMLEYSMDCCGGGPTAMIYAAVIRSNLRVIGPPWPREGTRIGLKEYVQPSVEGSMEFREMFPCMVVRNEEPTEWCKVKYGHYLYRGGPGVAPWMFFPSEAVCQKSLDPYKPFHRKRESDSPSKST